MVSVCAAGLSEEFVAGRTADAVGEEFAASLRAKGYDVITIPGPSFEQNGALGMPRQRWLISGETNGAGLLAIVDVYIDRYDGPTEGGLLVFRCTQPHCEEYGVEVATMLGESVMELPQVVKIGRQTKD